MTTTTEAAAPPARLPLPVFVLALGTFCLGTSEFMLAGLLPEISGDLGVSIPSAGLLITVFAVGMTIGAPVMTLLTLRLPLRATALGATAVFAVAHLLPLALDGYAAVVASRVVAAVACATYWAVAAVVAVRLSGEGAAARALATIIGGLTLANVLGVPGGTWIGQQWGWRAAFVAVALVTVAVTALLVALVPTVERPGAGLTGREVLRREVAVFRGRAVWLALGTTALFQAAVFAAFSYLSPLLTDVSGLPESAVPVVLLLFGVGSFVGVTLGGRYADRDLLRNVKVSLLATVGALLLLAGVASFTWATPVAVLVLGVASFSIAAALNGRVFALAGEAATLAASVNVAAFNVGNALGPWLGGLVIDAGLGLRAPVWVAVLLALLALALALLSGRPVRERARREVAQPEQRAVGHEVCCG